VVPTPTKPTTLSVLSTNTHVRIQFPLRHTSQVRSPPLGLDFAVHNPLSPGKLKQCNHITLYPQMAGAPDKNRSARDGHRGQGITINGIASQLLKLFGRLDHHRLPILIEEVNATVSVNGRGRVIASEAFLPMSLAGLGIKTRGDPIVAHNVEFLTDQQR